MALISFDNFLAPFRNKGQLIAIIVIIFVFAVFRWEGGGIEVRQDPNATGYEDTEQIENSENTQGSAGATGYVKPKDHFLDEMMAEDLSDMETAPEQGTGQAEAAGDPNSLDELERMVGLK